MIWLEDIAVPTRPVGTEGAVVSSAGLSGRACRSRLGGSVPRRVDGLHRCRSSWWKRLGRCFDKRFTAARVASKVPARYTR